MATSWKSQQGDGTYRLQFETDDVEKYKLVEKSAQMAVDGKTTADFVEVVRCKDCVYCDRCYPVKEINKEATEGWYCNPNRHYVKPDDFCSYGERSDT